MSIPLTCAGPSGSGTSVDITTGLVAWLKLDDGSGTNAADSSGNGNSGSLSGGASWGTGTINGDAVFDGVDGQISLVGATTGTTWTICAWIKPNSQVSDYGALATNGGASSGIWFRGSAAGANERKIAFYHSVEVQSTAALSNAAWSHFMLVNNAGDLTFYINNAASGTYPASGGSFNVQKIGSDGSNKFKGDLDDVRLYSLALSSEQRAAVYNYAG